MGFEKPNMIDKLDKDTDTLSLEIISKIIGTSEGSKAILNNEEPSSFFLLCDTLASNLIISITCKEDIESYKNILIKMVGENDDIIFYDFELSSVELLDPIKSYQDFLDIAFIVYDNESYEGNTPTQRIYNATKNFFEK